MKKQIFIGLACLTAGIGLAGCGASNNQPVETTTSETTAAETTTTTAETTTTTVETTTAETTTTATEAPTTTATEAPTTTAKAHPEDDQIMENLRNFYKSHEKIDGVPLSYFNGYPSHQNTKFAIADFDGDGENEVIFQEIGTTPTDDVIEYSIPYIKMYEANSLSDNGGILVVPHEIIYDVTFLDNGVAYTYDYSCLDNKRYFLINRDLPAKLNYNMSLTYDADERILSYYTNNGRIMKALTSTQDQYFDPKEKTQEQYETEKAILNSGNVIDLQVKDFTAENLGL